MLRLLGNRERLPDLGIRVNPRRDPAPGNRPQFGIVLLHRKYVVAARHRNAILGPFELRLKRQEILIRLEVGIGLGYREQAAERASNRGLFCSNW